MKKTILTFILMMGFAASALAHGNHGQFDVAPGSTLSAIWLAALLTAVVHTIMGPDHYLPFIAIAKSKGYSIKKTLLWTFVCGIGHIASALLIALIFIYFSHWLSRENFVWIEENRGNVAAYALIGLGAAYLLWLCAVAGSTDIWTNIITCLKRTAKKVLPSGWCLLFLFWAPARRCCRF